MKIGLCLSGGLAKGAFQCGFIKALLKYVPYEDIEIVSAASIGMINAYGLCANKMDEVENLWRTIHYDNIGKLLNDCWFHGCITRYLKTVIKETDELKIPYYCSITYLPIILVGRYYLVKGKYKKKWIKFSRASMGFPVITGWPKFYKGILTIDGGVFDNIPIYPLMKKHDLDLIFCLHFDSRYILEKEWKNSKTIVVDLDASLGSGLRKLSFEFNTLILNKMVDDGYKYGIKVCEKIFESGYGNNEGIAKSANDLYQEEFVKRMESGSIDRLVTTLNSFSKLFRREKCIKNLIKNKKRQKS